MKWMDYRDKLGIGFSDKEKARLLANKVIAFICHGAINEDYDSNNYYEFCLMTGYPYEDYDDPTVGLAEIFRNHDRSVPEIISYYIAFVNAQTEKPLTHRSLLFSIFCGFLDELAISHEIINDREGSFIFPKGAKELDDALVSAPLEWLKDYPLSRKEWINALKAYANIPSENPSEVADKFRKALERFFQEFFDSEKSLENMKSDYGHFLTSNGIPSEIKNNFEKVLDLFTKYMNNYAKHHDRTSLNVLEFILYQTGNLMRLLITLKHDDK